VGSVSLVERDLPGYDHWSPWLASLFVRPDCRHRGIGKLLVRHAEAKAQALGMDVLYLFTPGQHDFYAALNWSVVSQAVAADQPVTIMARNLRTQK